MLTEILVYTLVAFILFGTFKHYLGTWYALVSATFWPLLSMGLFIVLIIDIICFIIYGFLGEAPDDDNELG